MSLTYKTAVFTGSSYHGNKAVVTMVTILNKQKYKITLKKHTVTRNIYTPNNILKMNG